MKSSASKGPISLEQWGHYCFGPRKTSSGVKLLKLQEIQAHFPQVLLKTSSEIK